MRVTFPTRVPLRVAIRDLVAIIWEFPKIGDPNRGP